MAQGTNQGIRRKCSNWPHQPGMREVPNNTLPAEFIHVSRSIVTTHNDEETLADRRARRRRYRRGALSIMTLVVLGLLPGCRGLADDAGRIVDDGGRIVDDISPTKPPPAGDTLPKDAADRIPDPLKDPKNAKDVYDAVERERCRNDSRQCKP